MSRVVALLAGAACLVAMLAGPAAASTADPARPSSPSQSPGPPDVTLDPPPVPPAVPEGADDGSEQPTGDVAAAAAAAPQPATRAFGRQPYADVTAAAAGEATARRAAGCGISNATLAGTLLAITFTEAGPLASTTSAPSPMTLSRWDTNARLYAFANPSTPFPRAFWHPGVGLWQFDYPWQNTATERIDTRTSAALAAQVVAGRWCTSSATSDLGRFVYAVGPWHGCDDGASDGLRCLEILSHHFRANGPGLVDDTLVGFTLQDGVTRSGGARATQCQLAGESTARPCTFVDPGAAQGNRAWTATVGMPTPLAAPFYVVRVGTQEWRYWLRADTGYDRDIVARATIGGNPRTTLVWQNGAGLCDVTSLRGTCVTTSLPSSEPSTPALTSLLPGRLDLFARSSSGALTHRARPAGGSWTTAVGLGGALRSQPAAVAWSAGHVDVFVRGTDDALVAPGPRLGDLDDVAVVRRRAVVGPGRRVHRFRAARRVRAWHRQRAVDPRVHVGSWWTGWRSLGGGLTSSPAAVSWGPDRVAVFVRGTGGRVFQRTRTGSGWSSVDRPGWRRHVGAGRGVDGPGRTRPRRTRHRRHAVGRGTWARPRSGPTGRASAAGSPRGRARPRRGRRCGLPGAHPAARSTRPSARGRPPGGAPGGRSDRSCRQVSRGALPLPGDGRPNAPSARARSGVGL